MVLQLAPQQLNRLRLRNLAFPLRTLAAATTTASPSALALEHPLGWLSTLPFSRLVCIISIYTCLVLVVL